ncbi:hypothetical protein GALMADRAFT_1354883 [Galerina marginata CBS 339.88]|uniref:T6SS Phospholipase effector Tle1-like catalytic domain-containing protein n=1 Tax=Galerina marginata (strain CBS 339.88) TaxID=685588 RepID=A0A067SAY4_GALM3|nr:hypothetical protein GALMADRAFT_1354883 [Galerina marginata CBS 339.88]
MAEDPQSSTQLKNTTSKGVQTEDRSPPPVTDSKPWGCCHGPSGRNLIVSIDGTANQFGDKNTNVIELYHLILKGVMDGQRTWYNSGIGTYARPSWKSLKFYRQVMHNKIDLAIAWDFERTVMAAYRWLSDNYEPGDCIFLFGFSRGAFQVRVLSAMINKVGLIYKGNEMQIPFAYELYADPKSDEPTATQVGVPLGESPQTERLSSADRFKKAFSYEDVKVHFVGAWDTVSSIGIVRGTHLLPGTVDGMKHVCYFRHALALDERRVKFLPEYAYGGSTKPPAALDNANQSFLSRLLAGMKKVIAKKSANVAETSDVADTADVTDKLDVEKKKHQHTLEVWFAGTHSDIGGGNAYNVSMDRSRPPLRWMVFEAGALGLRTAPFQRELSFKEQIEIKESLTYAWWPLELLPLRRLTHTRRPNGSVHSHMPHFGSSRKIHPGQKIHSSLLLTDKTRKEYTPKARPVGDRLEFWRKDRTGFGDWLELDLYDYAKTLAEGLITEPDGSAMRTLRQTATSADGRQAVYEGFIGVLSDSNLNLAAKQQLITTGVEILTNGAPHNTSVKLALSQYIRELVPELRKGDHWEISLQFIERFTEFASFVLKGHTGWVTSVAFSTDGRRIVSGSYDQTVRIWDAETGKQVGEPFGGQTACVWSVAFSPDGKRVVSGSDDKTVRIWDAETGKQMGEPFRGHTNFVKSVAFSPDGRHVVSGSNDETVRIWDAETGKQVGEPFRGHTDLVRSVAFSPDGMRVVSGSDDQTVRIWDAETGKQVGEPFRGHTNWVRSVAFSPDGNRVVSGSFDQTVRIWDAETGKQVGEPFRGHTDSVLSVAFSPDGKRVVSGSSDETVRIWDAETGKQVGEPFRGHTDWVWSVAFSPDGRRIVSASEDKTVRIWDAETLLALAAPSQPSQEVIL